MVDAAVELSVKVDNRFIVGYFVRAIFVDGAKFSNASFEIEAFSPGNVLGRVVTRQTKLADDEIDTRAHLIDRRDQVSAIAPWREMKREHSRSIETTRKLHKSVARNLEGYIVGKVVLQLIIAVPVP